MLAVLINIFNRSLQSEIKTKNENGLTGLIKKRKEEHRL